MNVLVADDDPLSRKLVERTLQRAGYEVTTTGDGRDALERIQAAKQPTLAVVDWNMPGIDGLSLCNAAKSHESARGLYLILLTSRESKQDLVRGLSAGADDYLVKPTHPEELKARVRAGERILSLQERLQDDARRDPLTRLSNREGFMQQLSRASTAYQEGGDSFAVMFLDVDRFKTINDSLGHIAGDELICGIAERLRAAIQELARRFSSARPVIPDVVGRIGGDEFVVLLQQISKDSDAAYFAETMQAAFSSPFRVGGKDLVVTASIGVARSTSISNTPTALLTDADTAMYSAKSFGPGRYRVCDSEMHLQVTEHLALRADLLRAVQLREQFRLVYQPILSLGTLELTGFEALLRWERPGFGLVPPDEFIPIAEETGLIIQIGDWVLEQACSQISSWNHHYGTTLSVSVNVSAQQFGETTFCRSVEEAITSTDLPAHLLSLEITETLAMKDPAKTLGVLRELQDMGVKLSCDDFGTGFSSLSYLHQLPFNTLKIDRSFVSGKSESRESRGIVDAIMALAHNLQMEVVAEGVESEAEVRWLKSHKCDYAQGFHFARPLAPEDARLYVRQSCRQRSVGSPILDHSSSLALPYCAML